MKTLAYQVTEIQVVKPEEVSILKIQEGRIWAFILTCTPYGLNTHRLIVTGKRVPYEAKKANSMGELPSARELAFTLLPFGVLTIIPPVYLERERRRTINEAKYDQQDLVPDVWHCYLLLGASAVCRQLRRHRPGKVQSRWYRREA